MNTNHTLPRNAVELALYEADLDESALYDDYSGRGMYGASCFGIVGCLSDLLAFVGCWNRKHPEDDAFLSAVREDSMGLSTIYYFPGWKISE